MIRPLARGRFTLPAQKVGTSAGLDPGSRLKGLAAIAAGFAEPGPPLTGPHDGA
jgi:hypothetical protein